ncbi:MAG: hypothetical protein H0T48_06615 [Gemmatimonadaceae bacterium]|nr:hypothetical protein [Gemmatimonadaceae bacterium]
MLARSSPIFLGIIARRIDSHHDDIHVEPALYLAQVRTYIDRESCNNFLIEGGSIP